MKGKTGKEISTWYEIHAEAERNKEKKKKHKRIALRLLKYYVKCVIRLWIELYSKALYDVFVMKCLTARSTFSNAHFPASCCVNRTICMQKTTKLSLSADLHPTVHLLHVQVAGGRTDGRMHAKKAD